MPIAANTTALYLLENNVQDSSGLGNHGTVQTALTYSTTTPWQGTYKGGVGGRFLAPTSIVSGSAGCFEFAFTDPNVANTKVLVSIAKDGTATRALEIYHSGAVLYAYSNVTGENTAIQTSIGSKKWYVKTTWNGTTWKTYVGEWTVAGTVTLTEKLSTSCPSFTTPQYIGVGGSAHIGANFDGYLDAVRFRNVYDPSTTVTVDPSGGSAWPAHRMRRRRR